MLRKCLRLNTLQCTYAARADPDLAQSSSGPRDKPGQTLCRVSLSLRHVVVGLPQSKSAALKSLSVARAVQVRCSSQPSPFRRQSRSIALACKSIARAESVCSPRRVSPFRLQSHYIAREGRCIAPAGKPASAGGASREGWRVGRPGRGSTLNSSTPQFPRELVRGSLVKTAATCLIASDFTLLVRAASLGNWELRSWKLILTRDHLVTYCSRRGG